MVFPDLKKDNNSEQKTTKINFNEDFSDIDEIADIVRERFRENLENELDPDELADMLMDEFDVDSIRDQIIQQIKESLK